MSAVLPTELCAHLEWAAAIQHVLTKTGISGQSREIYLYLQQSRDISLKAVAERFGINHDVVKQIKSRLDRAVAAVEKRMMFANDTE